MKEVKSFTIDRNKWLRGEGTSKSSLLRSSDGKMCCLGIYLSACGVAKDILKNLATPASIVEKNTLPSWLKNHYLNSSIVIDLMNANDKIQFAETDRELSIKAGFKQAGIKIRFKG